MSDTFTYKLFKGEVDPRRTDTASTADDAKFHAEVATDYASDNTNDYLHFGWWVQVPKQTDRLSDYNLGVFAAAKPDRNSHTGFNALTGTATYTGSLMGLHTETNNNGKHTLSRLTGNASLVANFGNNSSPGSLTATFNGLKLNGTAATGSITFTQALRTTGISGEFYIEDSPNLATINRTSYNGTGKYFWIYTPNQSGPTPAKPTGIIGLLEGITDDGNKAFSAAFGARPE